MTTLAQRFGLGALIERWKAAREARELRLPIREWTGPAGSQPPRISGFDQGLVLVVIALLALGLVMVYSASVALPDSPKFARYSPTYFLGRHALFITISLLAALATVQVPVSVWERTAPWLFVVSLLLLAVVLLPHVGKGVNGARRWPFPRSSPAC